MIALGYLDASATQAQTQFEQDKIICAGINTYPLDQIIFACLRTLKAGRLTSTQMSGGYTILGVAYTEAGNYAEAKG